MDFAGQRYCQMLSLRLLICVTIFWLGLASCGPHNPVLGRWQTEPPSLLLYDFRSDGSVRMLSGDKSYPVFRYQLLDDHTIRLFDGMGRNRVYLFEVDDDEMVFYNKSHPRIVAGRYTRP